MMTPHVKSRHGKERHINGRNDRITNKEVGSGSPVRVPDFNAQQGLVMRYHRPLAALPSRHRACNGH